MMSERSCASADAFRVCAELAVASDDGIAAPGMPPERGGLSISGYDRRKRQSTDFRKSVDPSRMWVAGWVLRASTARWVECEGSSHGTFERTGTDRACGFDADAGAAERRGGAGQAADQDHLLARLHPARTARAMVRRGRRGLLQGGGARRFDHPLAGHGPDDPGCRGRNGATRLH